MYGAVGSLVLSWSWTRQPGFISFWCLWIQLCNNLRQMLLLLLLSNANTNTFILKRHMQHELYEGSESGNNKQYECL